MGVGGNGRLRFGDYEVDRHSGKLFRDGWPVKIQPQPLRVLGILLDRPGEIVSREQLRARIWGGTTFVEFDQGLNYCIRQIRLALRDGVSEPLYIETLPKQGYRFIGRVAAVPNGAEPTATDGTAGLPSQSEPEPAPFAFPPIAQMRSVWLIAAAVGAILAITGVAVYSFVHRRPAGVQYTQLTDFTDSAVAPALSPDGRMVAFIRGTTSFLTADQVYVKMLPNGEATRLTDDPRMKYSLAFSPDGSQLAYTVLEPPNFATYTVSVLGGDSHLLLNNAAGLTWLDRNQLLFSQVRSGLHMGIVTGTVTRENFRELYFPQHERAMAHYSYASPDRRWALVVEMDENLAWTACRLIALDGRSQAKPIGPAGACTSAAWSPDGSWMYFTAEVEGRSHLWRQRFPNGEPEQLTFGATEEEGVAVEKDGRSVITSMGAHESAIWIHDSAGDRSLSSEGEIITDFSPPSFSADGKVLYYLLRRQSGAPGPELWRINVESGISEAVFPGISMLAYDVSRDGKQVVYSTASPNGKSQLWLAPIDRNFAARRVGDSGEVSPHFGPKGQILFQFSEGNCNYLEQMNQDGSRRSKVVQYPIFSIKGVSPARKWVMAIASSPDGTGPAPMAIPVDGGQPRRICASFCVPTWSSDGKWLFVPVEAPSRTSAGRSLAIPVGPGESLPEFPAGGIRPKAEPSVMPGSESVNRAELVPGPDPTHFAYVNTTVHRNLYRVSLP